MSCGTSCAASTSADIDYLQMTVYYILSTTTGSQITTASVTSGSLTTNRVTTSSVTGDGSNTPMTSLSDTNSQQDSR